MFTATQPSVRDWARQNGYDVAKHGRLPATIHAAYRRAFGDAAIPQERPNNAAHCPDCGRTWTAARECHCTVCHRQFSAVRYFDDHRREGTRTTCTDPLVMLNRQGEQRYKETDTAWGKLVVSTAERPDDSYGEGTML
jgi:hypothetical protein